MFRKSIRVQESKRLTFRMDAQNIFNHPTPGNPSLNINSWYVWSNHDQDREQGNLSRADPDRFLMKPWATIWSVDRNLAGQYKSVREQVLETFRARA